MRKALSLTVVAVAQPPLENKVRYNLKKQTLFNRKDSVYESRNIRFVKKWVELDIDIVYKLR